MTWYHPKMDDDCHFVFVNNNRQSFKKGDQVYYCYGNRNNTYLLLNYGFCFPNNKYEDYYLRMRLDCDMSDPFVPELVDLEGKFD